MNQKRKKKINRSKDKDKECQDSKYDKKKQKTRKNYKVEEVVCK